MKVVAAIVLMLATMMLTAPAPAAGADEDAARSFGECVVRGGEVRRVGDDIACRHITSYTMRTYYKATTACGEEVEAEIWDEIRSGTVTYAFGSHRTVALPEVGETWPDSLSTPIPCLDNGSQTPQLESRL